MENAPCFTRSPALPARSSARGQGCLALPQHFASDFLLLEPSWGFSCQPHWDGNTVPGSLPGERRSCPTTTVNFKSDTYGPHDFSTQGHLISCSFTTILAQMHSRFHFNRSKMKTAQHPGDYCWNRTQKCKGGKALKHHHWEAEGTEAELQRHSAARSCYTYTLNIHSCYI